MQKSIAISVEQIETSKPYKGEGSFRGDVEVFVEMSDGTIQYKCITGEHSEDDMLINYPSPKYWNA